MLIIWRKARLTGVSPASVGTLRDVVVVASSVAQATVYALALYGPEIISRGLDYDKAESHRAGSVPLTACEILIVPEGGKDV